MKNFQLRIPTVVGVFSLLLAGVSGASWSYCGIDGPSNWNSVDSKCGGSSQSPINIDLSSTVLDTPKLDTIILKNFDSTTGIASATIENNGHTVKVSVPSSNYMVSEGGLGETYKLDQFHFHWGMDDYKGSEHIVDGKAYPMEVHFVTHALKYADLTTAAGNSDGVAVLGFFFEIGTSSNTAWSTIVNLLKQVLYSGKKVAVPSSLKLSSLLPSMTDDYYRYQGSLTTPACNEVVTWTVFRETIKISPSQMAEFRSVFSNAEGATNTTLSGNYRPIQSLGSRKVYTSYITNSAHALSSASGLLFGTLLWTMVFVLKF